jgi:hypothetical protein
LELIQFSTIYHPQTNGKIEVVNRSSGSLLRSLVKKNIWDSYDDDSIYDPMTSLFQLGEHAIRVSSNGLIDGGLFKLRLIKKMNKSSWWYLLSTHGPTLSSSLLVFIVWENKFIIYGFQVQNVIFPNIQPCMHWSYR